LRSQRQTLQLPGANLESGYLRHADEHLGALAAGDRGPAPVAEPAVAARDPAELYVSSNTIRTHTRVIFSRLGVTSRAEAVARARELGLR